MDFKFKSWPNYNSSPTGWRDVDFELVKLVIRNVQMASEVNSSSVHLRGKRDSLGLRTETSSSGCSFRDGALGSESLPLVTGKVGSIFLSLC